MLQTIKNTDKIHFPGNFKADRFKRGGVCELVQNRSYSWSSSSYFICGMIQAQPQLPAFHLD